jgi:uncharacterized protein
MDSVYLIIFSLLLLPGIFLVFIPGFPALLYMTIVAVIYGFVDDFVHLTPVNLLVLAGLFVVAFIVDSLAGLVGARYGGASRNAILSGIAGAVMGTLILPPVGGIVGLFLGVLIAELLQRKGGQKAIRAASRSVLGALGGMIINSAVALAFFIIFILSAIN